MIYTICMTLFLIGAIGLLAQLLIGGLHGAHSAHGGHGHAGHGGGHAHGQGHGHENGSGQGTAQWLLALLSPLTIFSVCLGTGATGLLLKPEHLPVPEVSAGSAVAGLAFYGLVVRPLWGLVFRFASKPSEALAGAVAGEAEVVTPFNDLGQGVVRLNVDGQSVRILAVLEPDDRARSAEIVPGDRLTVTSVDGTKNTCRVARL